MMPYRKNFYFPALKEEKTVTLRPLVKQDLQALEWEGEYAHFRNMYSDLYQQIVLGEEMGWVAETENNLVIGQAFIQYDNLYRTDLADGKQRAYLHGFRVRSEYRNAGLGGYIMEAVEAELKKRDFSFLYLAVSKDNPRALRLYQRIGYVIDGSEEGRWSYIDQHGFIQRVLEPSWRMVKKFL